MRRDRLPFLTPLGVASAAAAVGAIALAWYLSGGGIVSPGPLSRAGDGEVHGGVAHHAELGCGSCHVGWGGGTTSAKCLACHDDIAAEIAAAAPLHGQLPAPVSCLGCHTEHQGSDGEITRIDRRTFPHQATGFALDAHQETRDGARFGCGDCHGGDVLHFDDDRCSRCHGDDPDDFLKKHVAAWGDTCRDCHDGVDRFDDEHFDHGKTDYPLDGKHVGVACQACHRGVRAFGGYDEAPHRCVACHQDDDVHEGDNGDDCASCHQTSGWKPAKRRSTAPPPTPTKPPTPTRPPPSTKPPKPPKPPPEEQAPADHVFPLDHGGGGRVACATCHPHGNDTYTCFGCHHHTPANVLRIHSPRGIDDTSDCASCHPTGGRARRR